MFKSKANMCGRLHGYTFHHLKCDQAGYVQYSETSHRNTNILPKRGQVNTIIFTVVDAQHIRYGVIKLFGEYFQ